MSDVERYLDELFDRLAGTGAAGRRALAEAEDHLRSTVAAALARNVPRDQAEREAVASFGPPGRLARDFRRVRERGSLPGQLLSGAWLLAGLAVVTVGAGAVAVAVDIALVVLVHPSSFPPCAQFLSPFCDADLLDQRSAVLAGAVLLLAGGVLLGGRHLVRRRSRLPAAPGGFPVLAAPLFAAAGMAAAVSSALSGMTATWPAGGVLFMAAGPGLAPHIVMGATALAAALAVAVWGLVRRRRPLPQ